MRPDESAIDHQGIELLEFDAIRERLAGCAAFDGGAAMARQIVPATDLRTVADLRAETEEAIALDERAVAGAGGAFDLCDVIDRVVRGGVMDVGGLERLATTVAVAQEARDAVTAERELAPMLADRMAAGVRPAPLAGLAGVLDRALDYRGGILDSASPELGSCRRHLAHARREGADLLRRLAARFGSHLQESFTTQRSGRPVLAVKASSRSAVPGIVHDTSASGHTLFVEPFELIDANNRLRELEAREAAEVDRILADLSGNVRAGVDDLVSAIDTLAHHDLARARARLSHAWHGCQVVDGTSAVLVGARHPLLDPDRAVPIDVDMRGIRALVVSGPNTGGKTVALKTLGICAGLAQCGLRIPAESATLPVFDRILADIGDDQSIALNLSTFSAHVARLSQIIGASGPRSLVLLDEIAAGTDPEEGGPLATAVLERLIDQGATVLVTTHLGSLKQWAVEHGQADNAAVAIDPTTLRPRYVISRGVYGASHALDIAESLGLPDGVIGAARAGMSPARRQSDAMLRAAAQSQAEAEAELSDARREHAAAITARRDLERARAELHKTRAELRERLDADRAAVRDEARRDLEAASAELAALRAEIREARKAEARRGRGRADTDVRERDRHLGAASEAEARAQAALSGRRPDGAAPAVVGDAVRDSATGFRGVVVAIEGDIAVIQGDRARMRIPFTRALADPRGRRVAPAVPSGGRGEIRPEIRAAPAEVDVRGERAAAACAQVREAIDLAAVAGRSRVRIIHGVGTGALRSAVREELARHPLVDAVEAAPPKEGGEGATYAVIERSSAG